MSPFKTAWHHIRRSPIQSLIAVLVMAVSFFVISSFYLVNQGLTNVLQYFESKPEITLFLKDGLDKSTVEGLQRELSSYPNIKEIKFISKEKALSIYKDQNKDNPMLTEMVTAGILPASFEVSVSDPKMLDVIAKDMAPKSNIIDEVIYQKDIINSLLNWTNAVRQSGIVIISFLCAFSIVTIITIIGLKASNRKDEVKISRLLGASKFYVKKPFLIEGSFYGIFGSFIGSLASISTFIYLSNDLNNFFQPVIFVPNQFENYLYLTLSQILIGTFVGLFASWISVKRYIKY